MTALLAIFCILCDFASVALLAFCYWELKKIRANAIFPVSQVAPIANTSQQAQGQ